MFQDYYQILEIEFGANSEQIKSAFKKQAMKWHPDRNLDKDTTGIMQAINEAKLILLDPEARAKYDKEYLKFIYEKQRRANNNHQRSSNTTEKKDSNKQQYPESSENGYEIQDEELKRWMKNAQKQSVDLAKKTIEDFKGMVAAGAVAAGKEAVFAISVQIVLGILFTILVLLYRTCQH